MLTLCDLPSIRQFAGELSSVLLEGELVILGCPSNSDSEPWVLAILDALDQITLRNGGHGSMRLPCMSGGLDDPKIEFARALDSSADFTLANLVNHLDGETITVVTISCGQGLSQGWKTLLTLLGKRFKTTSDVSCQVLVILTDCSEFPPVSPSVGVRVRALWNVIRWEESRLLIDSMLPLNENALARAWRVSVYSAVSYGDPQLALLLFREMPNSLNETITTAVVGRRSSETRTMEDQFDLVDHRRWDVPPAAVRDWAGGLVHGASLERGAVLNISCMTEEDTRRYLLGSIWKEQVAGLLPVVMEMGFDVGRAVTNAMGEHWLDGIDETAVGRDRRVFLEPREMIDRLNRVSGGSVPGTISRTLRLLNSTRNELAHMRPVDFGRIRELWQGYDLVNQRFGRRMVDN